MKKRTLIRGMMICLGLTAFILCVMYIVNFRKMKTDESGKQNEDSAISAIVNLGRVPVQLTIPGVYRMGPFRYDKNQFIRKEGDFISWEELEQQGIITLEDGQLSTPWPEGDYGPENSLAQKNIDGVVVLPDKVTSIAEGTFSNCNISEIILPDGLKEIGKNTFYHCSELMFVSIPGSVKYIDESAFAGCRKLESVTFHTGLEIIEKNAFYKCSGVTEISLPQGLSEIGEGAFRECGGLKNVHIPDTVRKIGSGAFRGCGADKIKIPHQVEEIGPCAFQGVIYIDYNGSAVFGNKDKFWGAESMNERN